MAPPGGRRRGVSLMSVLVLLTFIAGPISALAVMGLDIGTKNLKAALVKPGIPLEIVLTKDSRRKEASAVAFKPSSPESESLHELPERLYGSDALALTARFPADVYPNLKPLLGLSSTSEPAAKEYSERYPSLKLTRNEGRGELGFKSSTFGTEGGFFSVEELLAMELKTIRDNAENMAGKGNTVRDAVVTVPAFYTADEKKAIELAANLAGIRVKSMMSDGLAVGLNFATSRTFPNINKGEKPEYHLVYDMGAGSTTATVLKFQAREVKDVGKFNKTVQEVKVMGSAWDRLLGGEALTDLIVGDMIEKFSQTKAAKDIGVQPEAIKSNGKVMAKLFKSAENTRQVLSANTATQSTVSGVYQEDIDFNYKLSRADFEAMAADYAARVANPLTDVLKNANVTMVDISSVILHGGAVRTPFVQKALEDFVGDSKKLKSNVNADEAAVFGAAFKAASTSPGFRVKEIKIFDSAHYPTTMKWMSDSKERSQDMFSSNGALGIVKQVPFKNKADFKISFAQKIPQAGSAEHTERPIYQYDINNLTASVAELVKAGCNQDEIKTVFSMRLHPDTSMPEVSEGSVSCETEVVEPRPGVMDDVKGFFGFGGKKDDKTESSSSEADKSKAKSSKKSSSISSSASASASGAASDKNETDSGPVIKKQLHKIKLSIRAEHAGSPQPSEADLTQMQEKIAAFEASDNGRRARDDMFNALESLIYKTRDTVTNEGFRSVSTQHQRDEIEELVKSTSEWLYPEGSHAPIEKVKERFNKLKNLIDPIEKRRDEASKRPKALTNLQSSLNQTEQLVSIIKHQIQIASSSAAASVSEASATASSAASEASSSAAEAASSASSAAESMQSSAESAAESATEKVKARVSSATGDNNDDEVSSDSDDDDIPIPTKSAKASATPIAPQWRDSDLSRISSTYESVRDWLAENMAAQDLLHAADDPVLLAADMKAKAKQLDKMTSDLLLRQNNPYASSSSSSSKAKATKTKSKTSSSSKSSSSEASATPASSSGEAEIPNEGGETAKEEPIKHEEL